MASTTVVAVVARAVVSAKSSSQRGLGSATRVRGVAVPKTSARLSTRRSAARGALKVSANGLPPNLAGMMGNMDPEKMKEIQEAYAKAMKDPETAKKVNAQMAQMQGMMNNPMVQKQMQAMNNMISVRVSFAFSFSGTRPNPHPRSSEWIIPKPSFEESREERRR